MNVIASNCCGGWIYILNNLQKNNPFFSMVLPYDSIYMLLTDFHNIDFLKYEILKSWIKPDTFVVRVDGKIDIHYVHYHNDKNYNELTKVDIKTIKYKTPPYYGHCFRYKDIKPFVEEKYLERVKRMIENNEDPSFFILQESYANKGSKHGLVDLAKVDSPYKRLIISTKDINISNDLVKTIKVGKIELPRPTVEKYMNDIKSFLL